MIMKKCQINGIKYGEEREDEENLGSDNLNQS
jgi:hypothetical protein